MQIIILAGGLATRLNQITESTPKSLIKINGKPFIEYQLDYLKSQNINDVIFCVGHLSNQIEDFLGDGSKFGMNIKFSNDGPKLLGTGGAIKNAIKLLGEDFFVIYGDSYLPIKFSNVFKKYKDQKSIAMMTILKNNNLWDKSNVIIENDRISLYDKVNFSDQMHYIDYGLTIYKRIVFKNIKESIFDLSQVLNNLSVKGDLDFYEVNSRFYEIGSINGINAFKEYISNLE